MGGEIRPDLSRKVYSVCYHHLNAKGGLSAFFINYEERTAVMQKASDDPSPRRPKKKAPWAIQITIYTFFIATGMTIFSTVILQQLPIVWAFVILVLIVLLGVLADIMGTAVTTAVEEPFLAMASKKVNGAKSALWMVRNAERVSNICNDVIGDICGIVSGSTGAAITAVIILGIDSISDPELWIGTIVSALIAAGTVGGKAAGKRYAMKNCNNIVISMGKVFTAIGIGGKSK